MNVLFRGSVVGELRTHGTQGFEFEYAPEWIGSSHPFPISLSMPLSEALWTDKAAAFVQNLLPEGLAREAISQRLRIAYDDDVSLLRALGGDTAGALQFVNGATKSRARKFLDAEALAGFSLGDAGPLDDQSPPRLSLAGAQYKTTVVKADDDYFWPSSEEASTHILKFDSPRFQHLSVNEYFVMKLAAALSLPVASVELDFRLGRPFLVVERFDRELGDQGVERIHQEDFCQILGLTPSKKYDVTLADVSRVLREHSSKPVVDIQSLVRLTIFNVLAGNSDAHAKNISMMRDFRGCNLAPFYDLVCTRSYKGVDRTLAMPIGNNRSPDNLKRDDWTTLAKHIEVSPKTVFNELERTCSMAPEIIASLKSNLLEQGAQREALDDVSRTLLKRVRATRSSF